MNINPAFEAFPVKLKPMIGKRADNILVRIDDRLRAIGESRRVGQ